MNTKKTMIDGKSPAAAPDCCRQREKYSCVGKKLPVWLVDKSKAFAGSRPVKKRTRLYRILTPVLTSEWAIIRVLAGFS